MTAAKTYGFSDSPFIGSFLGFIVALNRTAPDASPSRQLIEESVIRFSRLLYYAGLSGKYSRVIHEFRFLDYYLSLQSLRFRNRLSYTILFVPQAAHRSVIRLKIFRLLEEIIERELEQSEHRIAVTIDGTRMEKRASSVDIVIKADEERFSRTIKVKTGRARKQDEGFFAERLFPFHSANLIEQKAD